MITEGAEMEQGIYKIRFDLFMSGNHESDSKDLEGLVISCETEFIYDEKSILTETDQYSFGLLPGLIFKIKLVPHQPSTPVYNTTLPHHPTTPPYHIGLQHKPTTPTIQARPVHKPNWNTNFRFDMDFHVENGRNFKIM